MKKDTSSEPHLHFAVLATDVALFTIKDGELLVRLISVHRPPYFTHSKGLPGGLIHPNETADESAIRHLEEKADVSAKKTHVEQLYTFSAIDRDPRGRVVAVGYLAMVPWDALSPAEQANTKDAWWSRIKDTRKLAYDHDDVLHMALTRLRSRVTYTTLISKLMSAEFTLTELEQAYESIVKTALDKRNFRKKILKLQIVKELPHKRTGGRFRPAQLYNFASTNVREIAIL